MIRVLMFVSGGLALLAGLALSAFGLMAKKTSPKLEFSIESKPAIMACSYKVYGDRDLMYGRYWVAKTVLKNNGDALMEDVTVSYRIPGKVDWSTPRREWNLLPGQPAVDLFHPRVPYAMAEQLTTSNEVIEVKVTYPDAKGGEDEETRDMPLTIRGRNDLVYTTLPASEIHSLLDCYENESLSACFVTPNDPVIKFFTQQVQQQVLKGTTAGVGDNQEEVVRFLEGVYNAMLALDMVYGGTKGLPESIGESYTVIQHVRLPRELLSGGAGLCIELSCLYAAVCESAGLKPLIFLTSGHAWPGVQLADGSIICVESTSIGGEGLGGRGSFAEALEAGMKNLQIWANGGDDGIGAAVGVLDIQELHKMGIEPPELPASPALNNQLKETLAKVNLVSQPQADNGNTGGGTPGGAVMPGGGGGGETDSGGGSSGASSSTVPEGYTLWQDSTGSIAVGLPDDWETTSDLSSSAPVVTGVVMGNGGAVTAEFYVFQPSDAANVGEAIEALQQYYQSNSGVQIQYQMVGQQPINGINYSVYNGNTVDPASGTAYSWTAFVTQSSEGIFGLSVGNIPGAITPGKAQEIVQVIGQTLQLLR